MFERFPFVLSACEAWEGGSLKHRERLLAAAAVAAGISLCMAVRASAQLDVSTRLLGMNGALRGLVDDPITDAAFNPARLAGIAGRQFYLGRRGYDIPAQNFPDWKNVGRYPANVEVESLDHLDRDLIGGYRFGVTYFTPFAGGTQASFTVDVSADGGDRGTTAQSLVPVEYYSDGITNLNIATGVSTNEVDAVTLDAAISSARDPEARAFGVRVTGARTTLDLRYVDSGEEIAIPLKTPEEQTSRFSLRNDRESYEEWRGEVTAGWFRPRRVLREVSIVGSVSTVSAEKSRMTQDISDDDYDGNGSDPDGGTPYYRFSLEDRTADRDLTGAGATARVILEHSSRWRSRWSAGLSIQSGDGRSLLDDSYIEYHSVASNWEIDQAANQTFDVDVTRYHAEGAVAYSDDVADGVFVATVLQVTYLNDEYDETGTAVGTLFYTDEAETPIELEYPFGRDLSYSSEELRAALMVGVEWTLPKYLCIRFGAVLQGARTDRKHGYREDIDEDIELDGENIEATAFDQGDIDWSTTAGYRVGAGLNLHDRVWLDLYAAELSFTQFSYASLRVDL